MVWNNKGNNVVYVHNTYNSEIFEYNGTRYGTYKFKL